ncbi:MAG: hypothetical protein QOH13_580, partial [Thermoleophilaceae bacterium]|nr:hypothetical protein [Thermoleophilaceae bacterium]
MRGTRAYIASAGTAVVMLGASVCLFALVSAFVAFGSWPGAQSQTSLDQVVLRDAARPKPKKVAVRADAVVVARRATRKAAARRQAAARAPAAGTAPVAGSPSRPTSPGPTPAGQTQAASQPAAPVTQKTPDVATNLDTTTKNVTTQVQQQVQTVQTQ